MDLLRLYYIKQNKTKTKNENIIFFLKSNFYKSRGSLQRLLQFAWHSRTSAAVGVGVARALTPVDACGRPRMPVNARGRPWTPMNARGRPRTPMDARGRPRTPMDARRRPWTPGKWAMGATVPGWPRPGGCGRRPPKKSKFKIRFGQVCKREAAAGWACPPPPKNFKLGFGRWVLLLLRQC